MTNKCQKRSKKINLSLTEAKIQFWIELWEDLINNFLKKSFGLNLYNPHVLIDNIISEIEDNSFRSIENKKFFYMHITNYLKDDIVVNQKLKSQFTILRKNFNSERNNYILQTSKEIQKTFQNGLYFDSSLNLIRELILSNQEIDIKFIDKLNYYSQGLIVELIKKRFALKEIKKFLNNVFDNYRFQKEFIISDYPHEIKYTSYKNELGVIDHEKFNQNLIDYIDGLSIKDRINRISYYYYKETQKAYYIFVVEGLVGDIDLTFGEVIYYSLNKRSFVDDKSKYKQYEQIQDADTKEKFIQVAVEVDFLLPKSSLPTAIAKIENSIDIISCFFSTKTDIRVDHSNYIIVQNGEPIYISSGLNSGNKFEKHTDSINLNDQEIHFETLNRYSYLWDITFSGDKSILKIKNALHWFKKAEQSLKDEDKMLNYWIALENLFNVDSKVQTDILNTSKKCKLNLIQEVVSSVQVLVFVYEYGWELYHYYSAQVDNIFSNKIMLPDNLIEKAQLRPKLKEKIDLQNFISCLSEIKKYESNLFLVEKINSLIEFYNISSKTKSKVEGQIQDIKNDVLMIYRFRNLMVHNAHFDNTLLPYFVWKIRGFSKNLIKRIIWDFTPGEDLGDIMIKLYLKKEKFMQDFENGSVILFKNLKKD